MRKFLWMIICALLVLIIAFQLKPVTLVMAQSPLETPPAPLSTTLTISNIEPASLNAPAGGTLSIYGSGFTDACVVRLVNYGLLNTTFINPTSLTAQVPVGVPGGTYDLEISDGMRTTRYNRALTILAPTPTPVPTSAPLPPPPGRPILTIKNYRVEPQKVRAGQDFAVTIEIYNNGSRAGENTMATFPGNSFIPVGESGHLLWQLHINHTVVVNQVLRAPASLASGIYQVHVNLSANDWEGSHYEYPQTIPVEVVGLAPVTGQPRVTIVNANTIPEQLIPGNPFTLTMQLANRGSRTAVNVFARCVSEAILPAVGSDAVSTPKIGIEETTQVTLPLILETSVAGGPEKLEIALTYEDYDGSLYTNQETISVDVNASLIMRPQVLIQGYHTTPAFVRPGDTFTLSIDVTNVGGEAAQRLTLALGGENGAALEPFSPLQTGNVSFVEHLRTDSIAEIKWKLIVDGASPAKAYNLPVAIAYDDLHGVRHSETQRLSLIIRHRPELQVMFYREPEELSIDVPSLVSLEILNVGKGTVNATGISATGEKLDIQEEGTPFIGQIAEGGSAPLDITITPHEAGSTAIVVFVDYRDDFNQTQQIKLTLPVDIHGNTSPGAGLPRQDDTSGLVPDMNAKDQTLWQRLSQILKGFMGFGS